MSEAARMRGVRILAVLVALIALSHPIIAVTCATGACSRPAAVGMTVNAATGLVGAVQQGSTAAAAGLQSGDRVDFQRTGWTMHLWLWDGEFVAGRPFVLPIVDPNGESRTVTIVAPPKPIDVNALTFRIVKLLFALVILSLACGVIFIRTDTLTLAFYAFCMLYATSDNTQWMRISPPILMPLATLTSILPVLGYVGFAYLCLRFPTGRAIGAWRWVDRCLPYFGVVLALVYYLHFYQSALITNTTSPLYVATGVLVVLSALVGLAAYLSRFWNASGPDLTRMRWVAAAIGVYIVAVILFFTDQIVNRLPNPWIGWFFVFNPAPFAFAYALVKEHVVDIRVVGARTVVYAAVTSVPVALLAFVDWFFSRRLEDARLATVFEIAIALAFSFWLRALHKRIDRFSERIFFASRHRAFERIQHMTHALPFVEQVSTIERMLANETAQALQLSSAAVFRETGGAYSRTASLGWEGAAETLDADDSLVLFARSERRGVRLSVAPPSHARVPHGHATPTFALPVFAGRKTIAVVLYGGHRDGEALVVDEEQLLNALGHAAATAYEHLHAEERERENAALREQLKQLGAAY
jgi:hypothetical protein